ncbi:MAG: hypothetical protein Q9215_005503 [Flavoplaca cf. flavocitrina]
MDPSVIPPGYLKQDRGPLLLRVIWVFASLALTVVCCKTWTRFKVLRKSGLEDVFVLLGWVTSLTYGSLLTISVRSGLGKHPAAIEPTAILNAILWYERGIPLGMLSVTLPMFAITIVLDNITDPWRRQRRLLYGIPVLNLVIRIVNVILVFTSCPRTDTPKGLHTGTKCFSPVVALYYLYFAISEFHLRRTSNLMLLAAYISTVGFSAATEIFLTLWPIIAFWRLRLKAKDKIILLLLFSTTALIEGDAIVITACVPGLRPFIKYLRQKINPSQLPSAIDTPKKSNRNSEITVPASSVSLNRTDEGYPGPPNHKRQATTTEETIRKAKKEEVPIPIPPTAEDVEKQAFEKWRESEDTRWNTEEAKTSEECPSSKRGDQNDAS